MIHHYYLVIPAIPGTARKGRPSGEATQGRRLLHPAFLSLRFRGDDGFGEIQ